MDKDASEEILLSRFLNGDDDAFSIIFKKYSCGLYASAYNLFRNQHACEDMVQELFIELWEKKNTLKIRSLKSYLFVAIKNKALMAIRSGKVFLDESVLFELCSEYETDQKLIAEELADILNSSINKLPLRCQTVFKLSRFEKLSNRQIAERLNISVKTVESQMTIALSRLKSSSFEYFIGLIILSKILF